MDKMAEELITEKLTVDEERAIRSLRSGTATEGQQVLALNVIIKKFARTHDMTYLPDNDRGSAFLSGRAFVGQRILKTLNMPVEEEPVVKS